MEANLDKEELRLLIALNENLLNQRIEETAPAALHFGWREPVEEAGQAFSDLHSKISNEARDILPVAASARKALQDARVAETNAVRLSGRRLLAGPRCRDLAWRMAGPLDLVERLETYADTEP